MKLLIDCQLFPCVDYIKTLFTSTNVKFERYDNYRKISFRNRYIISGANGLCNLTIPLLGGREQRALMKDIKIDHLSPWQIKHWRSLVSAYHKAPFFEFYADDLKELIFSNENSLFLFTINILRWLFKILNINAAIDFSEEFIKEYEEETDYRNAFLPKNYNQLTKWKPRYAQVFEDRHGFQPNLSILDLIFCEGPNAVHLIKSSLK